jgi:hypothetical protein
VFFEFVRALASILAAVAALLGLYFGVTRAARLRRREQLFRESLTALTEHDPRRRIVSELHRVALADLISRQMTGSWRTIWPWFAWLVITALYGQIGYLGADYLASDAPWNLNEFLIATTGDGLVTGILMVGAFLGIFPQIYRSYIWALTERARVAQRFYVGHSIERPVGLIELEVAAEIRAMKSRATEEKAADKDPLGSLRLYGRSLVPGLFCASVGLLAGMQIWIMRQPGDRAAIVESLGAFFLPAIAFFTLTALPTASIWHEVVRELREIAPGGRHPDTPTPVRTELSRRASRHGRQAPRRVAGPVRQPGESASHRSRRAAQRRPGRRRVRWPARLRWLCGRRR